MSFIYTFILVIALLCSSTYLFGPIAAIFLLSVILRVSASNKINSIIRGVIWAAVIVFGFLTIADVFLPGIVAARRCARRAQCQNNMKQITQALLCYREMKKRFPPAHTDGENGKPMHSWRVVILPCLDRRDLYEAYDFNEPWDGPK